MKRFLAVCLVLVLCIGLLAGCKEEESSRKSKKDKAPATQGEIFDAGNVQALVPEGWKAFPVADLFADEEGATDPNVMTVIKDGKSEADYFTNPYIRINYYGPDTEMMGGLEEFYEQVTPIEPMKLGTHTWEGFTTTDYGGVMAVIWSDESPHQYQASIQLEVDGGDKIRLEDEDVQAILESIAPSGGTADGPTAVSYDWWDGSWYGWWCITDGKGDYAQFNGIAWDAYADITVDGDQGSIALWDSETTRYNPLMTGKVRFADTVMAVESGSFFPNGGWLPNAVTTATMEVGAGTWATDRADSSVAHFDHMIQLTWAYQDPTNSANSFTAHFFLRPWGTQWEDVKNGNTSGCLYSDMMPLYYDDWYLPLLDKGLTAAPDDYQAGKALLQ